MRVGSIVVVKKLRISDFQRKFIKWLPVDDEKTPYIIRSNLVEKGVVMNTLEEGIIGYGQNGDIELHIEDFQLREVLPPEDINEEIQELLSEPLMEEV